QKHVETYRDVIRVAVPIQQASDPFRIAVNYQGCADKGPCYPPAQMRADVSPSGSAGDGMVRELAGREMPLPGPDSLTPVAISSNRGRVFALSASSSLGMALFYTALGVGAGLGGQGLAATLQNPWVLSAFALMLVGLSLSMFGVYELQLPASFTRPVNSASHKLPAGKFAGVFAMGGLSALIVSPCVAAPLAAALLFISQTRDGVLGGTGLFALSAGMSVPL